MRLYIIDPENEPVATNNVNIHNHLYDSYICMLKGTIVNTVYKERLMGNKYYKYYLTSALAPSNETGKILLEPRGTVALEVEKQIVLTPHEQYVHLQRHDEIHSVSNEESSGKYLAFMVHEFKTLKERSTIYTREQQGDILPTGKVYNKYTEKEIEDLLTKLIDQLE